MDSTYDGYSIAYAVLKYLSEHVNCATLFSTHYHLLTEEFHQDPNVTMKHMACHVDDEKREVVYLYKLTDGVCPRSYGMNVARMAGLPEEVRLDYTRNGTVVKFIINWCCMCI
jgi:DNA mismatch repair protein MSH6